MSFILKLPTTTTTITTTTTTSTTTLPPIFNIDNSDISGSGFGNADNDAFGQFGIIPWAQVEAGAGFENVGDISFNVTNNNSTVIDNGDGSFTISLDITFRIINNDEFSRDFFSPRIEIELNSFFTNATNIISTFIPDNASKRVVLYTSSRLVAEFSDIALGGEDSPTRTATRLVQGTVIVNTTGSPVREEIQIQGNGFPNNTVEYIVIRNQAVPITIPLAIRSVGGLKSDAEVDNISIPSSQSSGVGVYNPSTFFQPGGFGHIILAEDTLTPTYFVTNSLPFRNGIALQTSQATTTTTTTLPPPDAEMRFRRSAFPSTTPPDGAIVSNGDFLTLYYNVVSSNFNPVNFRITVGSNGENIGFNNVMGNTGGVGGPIYGRDEIIQDSSLSFGVNEFLTMEFFNQSSQGQQVILRLFVDNRNSGFYRLQDTIGWIINPTITTTTTTTTTLPPPNATMRFRRAGRESSPVSIPDNAAFIDNGGSVSIYFYVVESNFGPVRYRLRVVTSTIGTGINNVVGNTGGVGGPTYTAGEVIQESILSVGTNVLITANVLNPTPPSIRSVGLQMEVDRQNNGIYTVTDAIIWRVRNL